MNAVAHIPVLCEEVMSALAIVPGERHVDATYGAGGYTAAMLARGADVCAFDRDPDAIAAATPHERLRLFEACFSAMETLLAAERLIPVDGVTLDIGVSSMQLDRTERGFSFQTEGPLDMRMAQSGESAADFLNNASEDHIANIIYKYGEEPKSRRIARAIIAARPLKTTTDLASAVRRATGFKPHDRRDPATRSFQAVRIYINRELEELEDGLAAAERILRPGGRLAVVTFHSLEDRMVKQFFRQRSGQVPAGSRHAPDRSGQRPAPSFETVSKPVRPAPAEIERNPRARSATLRFARRTAAPAWPTLRGDQR